MCVAEAARAGVKPIAGDCRRVQDRGDIVHLIAESEHPSQTVAAQRPQTQTMGQVATRTAIER